MVANTEAPTGTSTIEVSALEVMAGHEAVFSVSVNCEPACDLRGKTIEIRDAEGNVLATAEIATSAGTSSETGELSVKVPAKAGHLSWIAAMPEHETDGIFYPAAEHSIDVTVKAHPVYMSAWGFPYATEVGQPFEFKVGAKCGAGCALAGTTIVIEDGEGNQVATTTTGNEPKEGTESLFVADASIPAPDREGAYEWRAVVAESHDGVSHEEGSYRFKFRVVPRGEVTVKVRVIADKDKAPMPGARVVMHPYRAEADADGVATIHAAKGDYTLFVSLARHDPMKTEISLTEDYETTVEMVEENPEFNPDDGY